MKLRNDEENVDYTTNNFSHQCVCTLYTTLDWSSHENVHVVKTKMDYDYCQKFKIIPTERSFGSHKLPKTREKNRKECNVPNGKERSSQPCPSPLQS